MIAGILADKLWGAVIFFVACLAVVLIPAVVVQTVRIDGLDIFGLYAVKGYRPMYLQDEIDLGTLRQNNDKLTTGIATCNASVDNIKKEGDARTAAANAKIAAAQAQVQGLQSAIDRIKAIKSSKEICPVAGDIIRSGFQ